VSADPGAGPSATSGAGGRPDQRFPQPARAVEPVEGREIPVSVVATVNLTRNQGEIRFVNPLPSGRISGIEPDSQVALRAVGAEGQVIREDPVRVNLYSELSPDADREGLVNAVLPLTANVRAIELSIEGQVADAVRVGGPLPALRGAQRLVSDDDTVLRVGLALDRTMDEGHTYAIQVSDDHGRTWRTVGVGLKEPIFAMDRRQFHKGDELQVRVIATNGLSSLVVTTETFRV
jgi:hypothetical protein